MKKIIASILSFFAPVIAFAQSTTNLPPFESMPPGMYDSGASVFSGISIIIMLVLLVILVIANWKIFTKAGKPGWASIIPIYNGIVLLQIVNRPIWWIILFFIPFVNIIMTIILFNDLSKSFGKGVGFTIGLIFLSPIFILILGFGNAQYMKIERVVSV